jgi:hypothetical protein
MAFDIGADGDASSNYRIANCAFSIAKLQTLGGIARPILPPPFGHYTITCGRVVSASSTTVTLEGNEDGANDYYKDATLIVRAEESNGSPPPQSRIITAYNGTTKVATLGTAFVTTPTAGDGYVILGER